MIVSEERPFPPITVEIVTDPEEIAAANQRREQYDMNAAWYQAHLKEIYEKYRGKCICVAGRELFVANTIKEVLVLSDAAHPDDHGRFVNYIRKQSLPRIYAN